MITGLQFSERRGRKAVFPGLQDTIVKHYAEKALHNLIAGGKGQFLVQPDRLFS